MKTKVKRSDWGDLKYTRSSESYRGSPTTLRVLAGITLAGIIWAGLQTGPVVARELSSVSTYNTISNIIDAQNESFRTDKVYVASIKTLSKGSKTDLVEWPIKARIVAACATGYVFSVTNPGGDTVYRSSESTLAATTLNNVTLPDCMTVDMLDNKTQVPNVVDNITVARSTTAGGDLREAALVSWSEESSNCLPEQKPTYEVRTANRYQWAPVYQVLTTQDLSLEVPNIWNGSDYTLSVRAACNTTDGFGEMTSTEFSQTLPNPVSMSAMWAWTYGGTLSVSWPKVSSSPWVSYETYFDEGAGQKPLITSIREGGITLYPDNYSYGRGNTFSVRAISDGGAPTESASTAIQKIQ